MRTCHRIGLLAFALLLASLGEVSAAPAPLPKRAKKPPPPIEVAFHRIRIGMSERQLHALMSPYEEVKSGNPTFLVWKDEKAVVFVLTSEFDPFEVRTKTLRTGGMTLRVPTD